MKNKKFFIITILIILLLSVLSIASIQLTKNSKYQNAEVVKDILFEPYSNTDNLKILVTAEDTENYIEDIIYTDKNGKNITIYAVGNKTKLAIDYEIVADGEYTFIAHNKLGETIEKTLEVNQQYYDSLINIDIQSIQGIDTELLSEGNITINFDESLIGEKEQYKIGKSTKWNDYTGPFTLDSYQILENKYQEDDNKTLTIYAQKEDEKNNKIVLGIATTKFDLDMPATPDIQIVYSDDYAALEVDGVKLNSTIQINYDQRNDITNYYSLDDGNTWQEYTGLIHTTTFGIQAKSVKNVSGLLIENSRKMQPSAADSIQPKAYDEDKSTAITVAASDFTKYRIDINPKLFGSEVKISSNVIKATWSTVINMSFYDKNGNILETNEIPKQASVKNFVIPENTTYMCIYNIENYTKYYIYEITLLLDPDIMYVAENGNDETGDGTETTPYATLEKAISVAETGKRIYVEPGTYTLNSIMLDGSYSSAGITDWGKQLEIFGANEKTILIYNGGTSRTRDASALQIGNLNTIVRNLTYVFYPKSGNTHSRAIFGWCNGTVENVFFRISGSNPAAYLYNNDGGNLQVNNCTFFHDLGGASGNYSGNAYFTDIATNVVTQGTNANVITKSFGESTDTLENLIQKSKDDNEFVTGKVGVFYGDGAWK